MESHRHAMDANIINSSTNIIGQDWVQCGVVKTLPGQVLFRNTLVGGILVMGLWTRVSDRQDRGIPDLHVIERWSSSIAPVFRCR